MKNRFLHVFGFVLVSLLLVQCEKGDLDIKTIELGIDTKTNIDGVNRALQMRGQFYDSLFPVSSSNPQIPRISVGQKIIDLGTNSIIYIPFSISNLNPLVKACAFNVKIKGATGYWKTPAYFDTSTNSFAIALVVPKLVKLDTFTLKFNADICYGNNVYVTPPDSVNFISVPTLQCSDTLMGHIGLSMATFNLGNQKGKVKVLYGTGKDPDRIDLKYGGIFIFSTGTKLQPGRYPTCQSDGFVKTGIGEFVEFTFDYDPNISKDFTAYGTGSCEYEFTEWKIIVECPK